MPLQEITAYIASCDHPGCTASTDLELERSDIARDLGWWLSEQDDRTLVRTFTGTAPVTVALAPIRPAHPRAPTPVAEPGSAS